MRTIAVDWSGAARPEKVIWLGEVGDGRLGRLENGRSREEIGRHLIARAAHDAGLVVGLDFAFGVPAWFASTLGLRVVDELWEHLAARADVLIAAPEAPFWGMAGKAAAGLTRERELRRTDRDHPPAKSVFQLVGAGQVGSGTLRGMALLRTLRNAGFAVWPFDDARLPLVLEIYPRALVGEVVRKDPAERARWLTRWPEIDPQLAERAAASEHAFDAAVSAVVLWRHRANLLDLRREPENAFEGRIWSPGSVGRGQ